MKDIFSQIHDLYITLRAYRHAHCCDQRPVTAPPPSRNPNTPLQVPRSNTISIRHSRRKKLPDLLNSRLATSPDPRERALNQWRLDLLRFVAAGNTLAAARVGALGETEAVGDISTVGVLRQSLAAFLAGGDAFFVAGDGSDGGAGGDEGEEDGFGEVHFDVVGFGMLGGWGGKYGGFSGFDGFDGCCW